MEGAEEARNRKQETIERRNISIIYVLIVASTHTNGHIVILTSKAAPGKQSRSRTPTPSYPLVQQRLCQ